MKFPISPKLRWLLVIPATILFLYLSLYIVFYSSTFSNYVLTQAEVNLPGLKISDRQGSLAKGLRFDLRYTSGNTIAVLEQSEITITPTCLLKMSLCIESINITNFRLDLAKGEIEVEPSPVILPEISLPIKLSIEKITIVQLHIKQEGEDIYSAQQIEAAMALHGNDAELFTFSSADDFCRWSMSAKVALRQQYPLSANIACDAKQRFGSVSLALALSGDISNLIGKVDASISGEQVNDFVQSPAQLSLLFKLEALNPELLLNAELSVQDPIPLQVSDQSFVLSKGLVKIDGPLLKSAFNVESEFETSLWPGKNNFSAQFDLSDDSLDLKTLQLLLPKGQLSAMGVLSFSEFLHWQGEASWSDIDISQWQPDIRGVVSGRVTKIISYENEKILAEIELQDISGNIMDEKLAGSGNFTWRENLLSIQQLFFQQDQNKLTVNGFYSPSHESDISIELALPKINKLVPDAQGELMGSIVLSGKPESISISGELETKQLHYSDLKIANAHSHFNWHSNPQQGGDIVLSVGGLEKAERSYGNVELRGQGNANQHQLSFTLESTEDFNHLAVLFACTGSFNSGQLTSLEQWSGQCEQLKADFTLAEESQNWHLQSPIDLEVQIPLNAVQISDFCLVQSEAQICNRETIHFVDGDIKALSLSGSALKAAWINSFVTVDSGSEVEVQGDWSFVVTAQDILSSPSASAEIESDHIQFSWQRKNQKPISLDITTIDLDWNWQDIEHQINWTLESKNSGRSRGEVKLLDKNISGYGIVTDLQLAQYSRFIFPSPTDKLAGLVNAEVMLSGDLDFPLVNGKVSLQNGEFVSAALPVPLSEIEMNLLVENSKAKVSGSFQALEGGGQIGGEFRWQEDSWSGEVDLKAEDFTLKPNPNSIVRISPDLVFKFSPEQLVLSGEVLVPMARILVKELPEQAIATSPDTVIVGGESSSSKRTISTDLKVILGDDVKFTGFGLETGLSGGLNIQQKNDGLLNGNGVVQLTGGRYKAYGQNLKINSGDLIFVSDIENPQIRLEAIRDNINSDIEVGLRASGAASNPKIVLFSRPEMPDQAKFSYLLTGNPPGYDDGSEFDPTQAAAEAALSYALESNTGLSISRRAAETLGVKDLKIATSSGDNGTHIGLSGYLTPNLMVSYGVGVFDAVNTLTLDYRLRKNLTLEAISGESSALDLLWTFERD